MKKVGIYKILNVVNLKCYIGYSTDIKKRWENHRYSLKRGKHSNNHLQASYNQYGKDNFHYSIIEELPDNLTKQEYEAVETKWVNKLNAHKVTSGYNKCMPGNYFLKKEDENKTKVPKGILNKIISINIQTKEIQEFDNCVKASLYFNLPTSYIRRCTYYWNNKYIKDSSKSWKGLIFVQKKFYIENFDYINFFKPRKSPIKKEKQIKIKIIKPYEERNLKRTKITMVDKVTLEEIECIGISCMCKKYNLTQTSVIKCLKRGFKERSHKGYWFKRNLDN